MATPEQLLNILDDTANLLQKMQTNMKKCPKARLTRGYLEASLKTVEDYWRTFKQAHQDLVKITPREKKMTISYFANEEFFINEDLYIMLQADLRDMISTFETTTSSTTIINTSSAEKSENSLIQLPKIHLPTFKGNYEEWTTFQDLFITMVHNNSMLSDVQKLHYLKSSVTGEAELLLRHIQVTNSNYTQAWEVLKSRYGNKRLIVYSTLKKLFYQRKINAQTPSQLKSLLDVTSECLHSLKNLNVNTESWDPVIIFLVVQKLDPDSHKEWEECAYKQNQEELPTWTDLKQFLESKYRTLELVSNPTVQKEKNIKERSHHVATSPTPDTASTRSCLMCNEQHTLCHCKEFTKLNTEKRIDYVKANNLCFNCLSAGHSVIKCRVPVSCRLCHRRHHTILHKETYDIKNNKSASLTSANTSCLEENQEVQVNTTISSNLTTGQGIALLATAIVKTQSENGHTTFLRALIDQGSQASFISERAAQQLKLKRKPVRGTIVGVGSTRTDIKHVVQLNISSRLDVNFSLSIQPYVMSKQLTTKIPTQPIINHDWHHLRGLELADPSYLTPGKIDLLLGVKEYSYILQQDIIKGPAGTPCAQRTTLGWVIFGEVSTSVQRDSFLVMHHAVDFNDMLKSIWEVDIETKRKLTKDEKRCEDIYKETHSRNTSGRYIVKLPFKTDHPRSPDTNTKDIATKRLLQLERRFIRMPKLKQEYKKVMEEYLSLNHMEEVPKTEENNRAVYLPHHAVVREQKESTKTRVVFDASCKGENAAGSISLNDELLVGPQLQDELRNLVMRWRMKKVCFVADIEKMYRQVLVTKADADYQRILWRSDSSEDIKVYRLLTVTFGTASAPYLAVKTLHQVAEDEVDVPETENIKDKINTNNTQTRNDEMLLPERKDTPDEKIHATKDESNKTKNKKKEDKEYLPVSRTIKEDFYMDDLMSGADTVKDAISLAKEISNTLLKGGFVLSKWASNSVEFLQSITPERRSSHTQLDLNMDGTIKALGIKWNWRSDELLYNQYLLQNDQSITKRTILSDIQKMFDPLGWISPSIITAKILIQELWLTKVHWDEELDQSTCEKWLKLRNDFETVETIKMNRWLHTTKECSYQIHGFSDASMNAYAAAVYIRVIMPDGTIQTDLAASRTRVAPVRTISLPRLELCGALLLAKLLKQVGEAIREKTTNNTYAWTDSQIVISWLSGEPNKWKPFVANRVVEITDIVAPERWFHVPSSENPADIASRGMLLKELKTCNLWWKGPSWLSDKEIHFIKPEVTSETLELKGKSIQTNTKIHIEHEHQGLVKQFETFGSLTELLKTIVYCKRFLNYFKSKDKNTGPSALSTKELETALKTCILVAQRSELEEDIESLKQRGTVNRRSYIKSLNPYLDQDNILRVGGRLRHAWLNAETKHPVILGNKNKLTSLIIADAHTRTMHGGMQLMLTYIRSKYWIIRCKDLVRSHIHRCWVCARHNAIPRTQLMGDLPKERVTPSRPFLHTGVDFAGPLQILMSRSRGLKTNKAYIAIFVCLSTKAIHLELVGDLTSEAFIGSFKRFVSRRGRCSHLWSDQGRNFVGANKNLVEAWKEASFGLKDTAESLALDGTQWHFIPPYSPNFGGLWEAGVKSIKHHLKRVLTTNLTFEEMSTILCQIEACLNSRPITVIDDDIDNVTPLTPGHFLIGEAPIVVPEPTLQNVKMHLLSRWQHTQKLLCDFWSRWQNEYLTRLQQRPKWLKNIKEFQKGDIVLIKTDGLPPGKWVLGRIVEKHPGEDNITRVYSVKSGDKIVKRSITKLCAMPTDTEPN